ncbi:PaaX family transcriptional regulator C-terminal domain-containing protein [Nocardia ninae]|uniref:Putative repressor in the phenylacetic acid catabolism n=1 Tax=Nocardia ninae NBRC 108245 TaxID=1210091 RepID=A0A511MHQ4_9NOCA|nr:PaaX family transcriptional regulator C-terminal domain-containing protein [Nocardia ninae]GEM40203.1 putative repressor in the phenylacetic acid catabolism [Nocardia ninae NBRC 108245]
MVETHSVEVTTRTLVESMVREDATIDAGALYTVANALGMTDQQVRLCVRRLVADGQFTQQGRGRKAILHATAATASALAPDVEFVRYMFAQDRGEAAWDGLWHLVAFAIPETARSARDAMRDGIVRLGGAPIQGGLYVSPNAWEQHLDALAAELDVTDHLTTFTTTDLRVGQTEAPRRIAARLWPLDEVAARHRRLLDFAQRTLRRLRTAELSDTELLTVTIELAAEFTRAMEPDPLLPPQLLPQPWAGTKARGVVAECWALLLAAETSTPPRLFRAYADVVSDVAKHAAPPGIS